MRILAVLHKYEAADTRSDSRRPVDLSASFRRSGAGGVGCLVANISAAGFMAKAYEALPPGAEVWLNVPGFAPLAARIVWSRDGDIGCAFAEPLDAATLHLIVADAPQLH